MSRFIEGIPIHRYVIDGPANRMLLRTPTAPIIKTKHRTRSAFTLLEVVLTLSMAVVLMSLVGATLQFYATNMNVRDTDVRRVHLATSILQMIADDLRASLYGASFDASTLESFLAASATGGAASAVASLDPAAAETLGTAAMEDASLSDPLSAESTDLVTSTLTLTKPGMIGNQYQIQFDISRLPRLEQWSPTLSASPGVMADVPSDIKTVTYYVQAPGTVAGVVDPIQGYLPTSMSAGQGATGGGLVRRELDRAASNWATESGGLTGLMMTGDLIASEVVSIGFEYFDGIIWQIMWNSDEVQAMPKAVRITLTMSDPTAVSDTASVAAGMQPGTRTFTHVVLLPVGMAAAESTTPDAEALPATGTGEAAGTSTSSSGATL